MTLEIEGERFPKRLCQIGSASSSAQREPLSRSLPNTETPKGTHKAEINDVSSQLGGSVEPDDIPVAAEEWNERFEEGSSPEDKDLRTSTDHDRPLSVDRYSVAAECVRSKTLRKPTTMKQGERVSEMVHTVEELWAAVDALPDPTGNRVCTSELCEEVRLALRPYMNRLLTEKGWRSLF